MNYHGEGTLQSINKRMYFLNSCRISGYFDTKFTTMVQIEPILFKFKDQKIDNILNLEQVYFLVTRVICNQGKVTCRPLNSLILSVNPSGLGLILSRLHSVVS